MDILYHIVICIDAFVSFSYMCNNLQHLTDLLRTMDEKRVQCFPCNLIPTFTLLGMFSLSHWGKALKRPCQNIFSAAYHDLFLFMSCRLAQWLLRRHAWRVAAIRHLSLSSQRSECLHQFRHTISTASFCLPRQTKRNVKDCKTIHFMTAPVTPNKSIQLATSLMKVE